MKADFCKICHRPGKNLCKIHATTHMYDSKIHGFRFKKRNNGSRHTTERFHKSESTLSSILERFFGYDNVVTSYHPLWAKSVKDVLYEFDILLIKEKILVEFHGYQHFKYPNIFHKTKKEFQAQRRRDRIKQGMAAKNGYKLIIFRYDEPMIKDYIISKIKNI